jgi:carbonic anhydrase
MEEFRSFFIFPNFSAWTNPQVYIIAFTLAVVASLETLLCVEATDKLDPGRLRTPANHELKVQGLGNMLSGLLGGLPVTQVIVRSSANLEAGGRSKVAAISHGIFLLLTALLIPGLLNKIPLASLACILIMVGYKLSKVSLYSDMIKKGKDQFLPFITTILAIIFSDLLTGIGLGMIVAIYFILLKNYRHALAAKTILNGENEVITIQLAEDVSFLNKASVIKTLEDLPSGSHVHIDGSKSRYIDDDILEAIEEYMRFTSMDRHIKVTSSGLQKFKKDL